LNLGLGIHPGIVHFKEKWGGQPLLNYFAYQKEPEIGQVEYDFFAKL
jgi:hypothetical protein